MLVAAGADADADASAAPAHVPNALWQPAPASQWSVVDPHQPCCEQQFPKGEPAHVEPVVPAQVPSVETLAVEEAEGEGELDEISSVSEPADGITSR